MKILKEEELVPLRNALEEVQKFIREIETKTVPYYYLQFDNMINNIEIYIQTDEQDMRHLNKVLLRDWLNANHTLLGVPACRLLYAPAPYEVENACHFIKLIMAVAVYFPEETLVREMTEE